MINAPMTIQGPSVENTNLNVPLLGIDMLLIIFLSNFDGELELLGNGHDIQWSDLFMGMNEIGNPILKIRTNSSEAADMRGNPIRRHRVAELCPVGALGWSFFLFFHVFGKLSPDFTDRVWRHFPLFESSGVISKDKLRSIIESGPFYSKWYAGLYTNAYNPFKTLNEERTCEYLHRYNAKREHLDIPPALVGSVYPWIGEYRNHLLTNGEMTVEQVEEALQFFDVLEYLTIVVIQDAVVLYMKNPDNPLLRYSLFNSDSFHNFACDSQEFLQDATPCSLDDASQQCQDAIDASVDIDEFMDSIIDWSLCEDANE